MRDSRGLGLRLGVACNAYCRVQLDASNQRPDMEADSAVQRTGPRADMHEIVVEGGLAGHGRCLRSAASKPSSATNARVHPESKVPLAIGQSAGCQALVSLRKEGVQRCVAQGKVPGGTGQPSQRCMEHLPCWPSS